MGHDARAQLAGEGLQAAGDVGGITHGGEGHAGMPKNVR
jgi:hypothetical protein